MGCCISRGETGGAQSEPASRPKYSWEREERVDLSLLIVSDKEAETLGRLPGQLEGKQFAIRNCSNCTILVLDHTQTVTVDKCRNCDVFIAPSKGSVYIRNCTNCNFVVACQQFRARDCDTCSISLFSYTRPVIEASKQLEFRCMQCSYPQLKAHFDAVGLSVFNNQWSSVHDFDRGVEGDNWSLAHSHSEPPPFAIPSSGEFAEIGVSFSHEDSVIPLTLGLKDKPAEQESCLVVFFASHDNFEESALSFVRKLQGKAVLVHSRKAMLKAHEANQIFADNTPLVNKASEEVCIMLDISGDHCVGVCQQLLEGEGEGVYVSPNGEQGTRDTEAFEQFISIRMTM